MLDFATVAKRFYARFKVERAVFLTAVQGLPTETERMGYTSLMLNRLMFVYFLQHSGLLDDDTNYLYHRLHMVRASRGEDVFYRYFLLRFFREGLGGRQRTTGSDALLGKLPDLDPGLFKEHVLERGSATLFIADDAFVRLFAFFDSYQWQLGEGPLRNERELRPAVLGFVCEQSANRKGVGAYYTGEDVAEYIARNTIIPRLLETVRARCPHVFEPNGSIWQLLQVKPHRYIREAVQRIDRLPMETEREYRVRRLHCEQLRTALGAGDIHTMQALIACNLDLYQFACDVLEHCQEPDVLQAFYECLTQMTVLDPTCGTGAFLFAALDVLEPIYKMCIRRLQELDGGTGQPRLWDQRAIVASIITNNLYGVDIMGEAVEICKMRLLLRLLAHIDHEDYNALSNVHCNLRVGNALAGDLHAGELIEDGYDTPNEIGHGPDSNPRSSSVTNQNVVAPLVGATAPTTVGATARAAGATVGATPMGTISSPPFRWSVEFGCVMERGGFDVIIGNPPYVEYSRVRKDYTIRGYETGSCGNLYAVALERSLALCRPEGGYMGLIVPLSICGGERFGQLRATLRANTASLWLSNFEIFPSRLFEGAFQRLSILLAKRGTEQRSTTCAVHVTHMQRWYAAERSHLLPLITYVPTQCSVKPGVFPKLASACQEAILHKVFEKAGGSSIVEASHPHRTEYFVSYQEATNYWIKATCSVPFYRKNGLMMEPPHGRFLFFRDEFVARTIMALMNSSLFYLWFATYSDGFHLSHTLVKEFPVAKELYALKELPLLAIRLEEDIKRHARMSTRNTKTDMIEIEEYRIGQSKALLDEIDAALARYYHFTDDELEFIIHYDQKYRMGSGGQ